MQRSTAVAARAIVMLACLVVIPLVAVFGSSSSELVARIFEGRWGRDADCTAEPLSRAPEFRPEDAPPLVGDSLGRADTAGVVPAQIPAPPGPEMPAGYNAPAGMASPGAIPSDGRSASDSIPPAGLASEAVGLPPRPASSGVEGARPAEVPRGASPPPSPSEGGTFTLIQERLRDLGAVYYRLESWGSRQQLFRFQCEMAVEGSPGLTRHFEAVDSHPLLAMHKVLVEAEAWHASR